ncbi:MAG TPA: class I SAM-dependent methyltransferase [Thermomicrobiales bacterium]
MSSDYQTFRQSPRGWLLHRAFAALYGAGAPIYDRFTSLVFAGEWSEWQRLALRFVPPGATVIELGCGTGQLAAQGQKQARRWIGIDRSARMLRQARRRSGPRGPWLIQADARALPIADGAANVVVTTFPAPFILEPATHAEIRRILRPGGQVVIILSGELAPNCPRRRITRWILRLAYGRRDGTAVEQFALPGFTGRVERLATPGGWADVYVGQ